MSINKPLALTAAVLALGAAFALPAGAQQLTRDNGSPVGDNQNSQTAGPRGPVLLQDSQLSKNSSASTASASPNASSTRAAPAFSANSFPAPTSAR